MVELLERFVAAIESIAHSYSEDVSARLNRTAENIDASLPPAEPVEAPPATSVKRGRKPKAADEAKPGPVEPGDAVLKEEGIETKPGDPGHKYAVVELNKILQQVALHPKLGHPKAKAILLAHAKGAERLKDCDPAVFEGMWKECKEVLYAAGE
jgi:hypothetical protein